MATLAGDEDGTIKARLMELLPRAAERVGIEGFEVRDVPEIVTLAPELEVRESLNARMEARELARANQVSGIIWGRVLTPGPRGGEPRLDLGMTWVEAAEPIPDHSVSVAPNTAFDGSVTWPGPDIIVLPKNWHDLEASLPVALLVHTAAGEVRSHGGDVPAVMKEELTRLEQKLLEPSWSAEDRWRTYQILGSSWTQLGKHLSGVDAFSRAAQALRAALAQPYDCPPACRAKIQSNLGCALRSLGERTGDVRYLLESKVMYESAIGIYEQGQSDEATASARVGLGLTLSQLGEMRSDSEDYYHAVTQLRAALEVYRKKKHPYQWAEARNNLGVALGNLGKNQKSIDYIRQAEAAHRDAIEVLDRNKHPLSWADAKMNLAVARSQRGGRALEKKNLQQAVADFRDAIAIYRREARPFEVASAQLSLGVALVRLGERERSSARFEDAVDVYRAALVVFTREAYPRYWAGVKLNLGNVLDMMGEFERGPARLARLREAVAAYEDAGKEYERMSAMTRASLHLNFGAALSNLGELERGNKGVAHIERAVAMLESTFDVYTPERHPHLWAMSKLNQGSALVALGHRFAGAEGVEFLKQAVVVFRQARAVYTPEEDAMHWRQTEENLGITLFKLAKRLSDPDALDSAIASFDGALRGYDKEEQPEKWSSVRHRMGDALYMKSKLSGAAPSLVCDALAAHLDAWEVRDGIRTGAVYESSNAIVEYWLAQDSPDPTPCLARPEVEKRYADYWKRYQEPVQKEAAALMRARNTSPTR